MNERFIRTIGLGEKREEAGCQNRQMLQKAEDNLRKAKESGWQPGIIFYTNRVKKLSDLMSEKGSQ